MEDQFKVKVTVTDIRAEARDVMLIELRAPDNRSLPAFQPGAHLEINLPGRLVRHYSLANDCREKDRYLIGVGRVADSRGGSDYIHTQLRCGDRLTVAGLRNNFPLDPDAGCYLFIAGGIGITPIMTMIRWCVSNSRPWRLIYANRSRQRASFHEELQDLGAANIHYHFDSDAGRLLDVSGIAACLKENEQIYCCGPAGLMSAVEGATVNLQKGRVFFEYFKAPDDENVQDRSQTFSIHLKRAKKTFEVGADQTILEVLEENGIRHPHSCREGTCGTCEVAVCEGVPDHRDYVLSDEEQEVGTRMMICVSRAKSDHLVLDL